MRLLAALALCLLGTAAANLAQSHAGPDEFSICAFTNSAIGACEPLTDTAVQGYSLTAEESRLVKILKRFAATPTDAVLDELLPSFGVPQKPLETPKSTDHWLPERPGGNKAASDCFACGVHLRLIENVLYQITYSVNGKFSVIWNRELAEKPPQ
jgi:hypothetical protein